MTEQRLGLALSGGGARGFAHIGVLKVLERERIPIAAVTGTSAGSFVGAALAAGLSAADIETAAADIVWSRVLRPSFSAKALLSTKWIGDRLSAVIPPPGLIEEFPIPFAAVAFDVAAGEEFVFRSGRASEAVRASCAVPGLFAPLRQNDGRILVDGGVTSPLPVKQLDRSHTSAVIAVDLVSCGSKFGRIPSTGVGVIFRSALKMIEELSRSCHHLADVVIEPQIAHIRHDEIGRMKELIELGEAAAEKEIAAIRRLTTV